MASRIRTKSPVASKHYTLYVTGVDAFHGTEIELRGSAVFYRYTDGSAILCGRIKTPYGLKSCKCDYDCEMRAFGEDIPADGSDRDIIFSWREAFRRMREA